MKPPSDPATHSLRSGSLSRFLGIALVALLARSSSSQAQPLTAIAVASTEQKRVSLSESVRAVVVVVAPAPLRIETPRSLLAPESDRDWKIQPVGAPAWMPLLGLAGWECWVQTYRLDPYVLGNALPVAFAPLKVNGREVMPTGFEITVYSTVNETRAEAARPITGIEPLEVPPATQSATPWGWIVAGAVIVGTGLVMWRWRYRPRPVPPREWATAALNRLEREESRGVVLIEGVAGVLRGFIDRRFGIPAPQLTTTELLIAAERAGWSIEETDPLRRLLEICDRAKFAGDIPGDDGCRNLLAGGRDWVNRIGADTRPG